MKRVQIIKFRREIPNMIYTAQPLFVYLLEAKYIICNSNYIIQREYNMNNNIFF